MLLLSPALHLQAEDVLMPQLGKQVVEVAADQVLTYYDYKGTESMPAMISPPTNAEIPGIT